MGMIDCLVNTGKFGVMLDSQPSLGRVQHDFGMILGVWGPPRHNFERSAKQGTKMSAVPVHFGRLGWSSLPPKSDFRAFRLRLLCCLFLVPLLGGLQ